MFSMKDLSCLIVVPALLYSVPAMGQVIYEDLKLNVPEQIERDIFGASVTVFGNIVAVGSTHDDDQGDVSGSAYLFDLNTGEMTLKLLPSDGHTDMRFGNSIDMDGDVVAVGAQQANIGDGGSNSYQRGAVYLFNTQSGEQIDKLVAEDGQGSARFGHSVSLSDGLIGIGAYWAYAEAGSAYVFDADSGSQIQNFLAFDGEQGNRFGSSVVVSDGLIVVGSARDSVYGEWSGSVHVFDALSGSLIRKISPADGNTQDYFGFSVALEDGLLAVGAFGDDDRGSHSGSVYLFDVYTGEQLDKIYGNDTATYDVFGSTVVISDGIIAVGAQNNTDFGYLSGSAYLFRASTGNQIAKLLPSDGAERDSFGRALDISAGRVVVSALYDDDYGLNSGSVYVFTAPTICVADLTGDGTLDYIDVSAFIDAIMNEDRAADFTGDGSYDFFDVSAFLVSFNAGCP